MPYLRSLTTLTLSRIDCASRLRRGPNLRVVGAGLLTSRLHRIATFQLLAAASRPSDDPGGLLDWIESRLPAGSALAGYRLKDDVLPALAHLPGGSAGRVADMVADRPLVDLACLHPDGTPAAFRDACFGSGIASHGRDASQAFDDWMLGRTSSVVEEVQVNAVAAWILGIDMIRSHEMAEFEVADNASDYLQAWLSVARVPALDVHVRLSGDIEDDGCP